MADVATSLKNWDTVAGNNQPQGSTVIGTNLDDNQRVIQSVVRYTQARASVASASPDLSAVDAMSLDITGASTISSFGTVSAGIRKWMTFASTPTLTHNATSLILPTAASITAAAGDTACFESLGSGNWRCLTYNKANGQTVALSTTFGNGTVGAPSVAFTSDTSTGMYRIGASNIGFSVGGAKALDVAAATTSIVTSGAGTYSFGNALTLTTSATAGAGLSNILVSTPNVAGGTGSGTLSLTTGNDTLGTAGALSLTAGAGYAAGGAINITGGGAGLGSNSSSALGDINISGGSKVSSGNPTAGGSVILTTGYGLAGTNSTGRIKFVAKVDASTSRTVAQISALTGLFEYVASAGTPTISAGGGTGATIVGSNYGATVTFGTSPGTTLSISLAQPGSTSFNIPSVTATYVGAGALTVSITTLSASTVSFSLSGTPTAGDKLCINMAYYA